VVHDSAVRSLEVFGYRDKYITLARLFAVVAAFDLHIAIIIVDKRRKDILYTTDSKEDNVQPIAPYETE
jgi:hypothetical protein